MLRTLPIAALLFLAACSPQEPNTAPANDSAPASEAAAAEAQVPSLVGQWAIAAIDGKPMNVASTAAFQGGKATISSGCHRRAWTYTQKRNVVALTADPGGSSSCGDGTSAEQEAAFSALGGASIAIFAQDGAEANLSGTGGNLTLQRR